MFASLPLRALLFTLPLLAALPGTGDQQKQTAPFPRHGKYVGMSECVLCHEVQESAIRKGHHAAVLADPSLQQCESCHGPGHAHTADEDNATELITHPPSLRRQGQIRLCSRCHQQQIENHRGDLSGFFAAGKVCTSCHKVHQAVPETPYPDLHFHSRGEAVTGAAATGARKCLTCHPRRDDLLQGSYHRSLATTSSDTGCETCHGHGALHVATSGLSRLITRPDRAKDGAATCRSCHDHVDAVDFHWQGRKKPLLSDNLTCTSCHRVHSPVLRNLGGHAEGVASTPRAGGFVPASRQQAPTNRVCMKCHAPALDLLVGTIHETVGLPDTALDEGCGACHAGAFKHANNAGRRHLVSSLRGSDRKTQLDTCARCHSGDQAMRHVKIGSHHRRGVSCLSCHSPAAPKGRVRADAEKNCATCHQDIAAAFRMPNHHPVDVQRKDPNKPRLGQMGCTHCHDPHAARPKIRNRVLRFENCVKCHKRYRGPFVFQHQADRSQHCVVCHTPHGSPNKRLLKQANSRQNCLQCHGDFPAFHDQTQGAVFTNCLRCHTEVHGSNHSRYLFR
jgi:DmsE family decaheme c-type cytochrome